MGCGSSNEVEELDVNENEKVIYFTNHSIKCLNCLKLVTTFVHIN